LHSILDLEDIMRLLATIVIGVSLIACGGGSKTGRDGDGAVDVAAEDGAELEDTVEQDVVTEVECTVDGDCDDSDPCTTDWCDTDVGECDHASTDEDGDGYPAAEVDGTDCGGTDCDDGDEGIFPASDERRCAQDADCNGRLDADNDGDGHDRVDCGGDDCEDEIAEVNPGASPGCGEDGSDPLSDLDCNGHVDADNDGDGHLAACASPATPDCDDGREDTYPGAPEVCLDGVDQDCDGSVDGFAILGSDVQVSTAGINAESVSAAWTGSEYVVVWSDERDGDSDVFLGRVLDDGSVASEILVSGTSDNEFSPSFTWTGSTFPTVYMHLGDMVYRLLDAEGATLVSETVVDPYVDPVVKYTPELVWSGSELGASWLGVDWAAHTWTFHFSRLGLDGTLTAPGDQTLVSGSGIPVHNSNLAWTGSEFVSIYYVDDDDVTGIRMARASAGGVPVGTAVEMTYTELGSIQVGSAWSGSEFMYAYQAVASTSELLRARRVTPVGGDVGAAITLGDATYPHATPCLSWTGDGYGATWVEDRAGSGTLLLARMSPTGAITELPLQLTDRDVHSDYGPDKLVWTGTAFGAAWVDDTTRQVFLTFAGYCE
jgi:hypothetical protein